MIRWSTVAADHYADSMMS